MTRSTKLSLLCGALTAALALGAIAAAGVPDASAEEYKSKARKAKLLKSPLRAIEGMEANVIRFEFPPGYVGGKHTHTGDVFVYVQKGSFTVDVDGKTRTFAAGQVYHETPNVPMVASNGSAAAGATIVVFQVGKTGEPIMMKVK